MNAKSLLTPRRVIGGIIGAVALTQVVSRMRSSAGALPDGVADGIEQVVSGGGRSVRGLGLLAVTATAALALPAYRRLASAKAAADA